MTKNFATMGFTIGTDPEFVLRDEDGNLKSAIDFIKGTKHEPEKLNTGGAIQHDNVMVEFCTPPADGVENFVDVIRKSFMEVASRLPKGYSLDPTASENYGDHHLDHPEAQEFGCEPDFDAWELMVNRRPECEDKSLRSCGGHIHVGYKEGSGNEFLLDDMGKVFTVRALDLFLGVPSVVIDTDKRSVVRRKLYGKAGAHRPKEYGVEYRVLSNFFFKSPQLVMLVHDLTETALKFVREEDHEKILESIGHKRIINTINKGIIKEADKLINDYVAKYIDDDIMNRIEKYRKETSKLIFTKEWKMGD